MTYLISSTGSAGSTGQRRLVVVDEHGQDLEAVVLGRAHRSRPEDFSIAASAAPWSIVADWLISLVMAISLGND